MEAVKMPSTTQVKSQVRTASADTAKGGDEFMKLLQVKKDQVQPDKAEEKKTDGQEGKKDVSEDKKDDSKDVGEEDVSSEDTTGQEVLLQAAMQQTAAQMAGIVTQQPQEQELPQMQEQPAVPVKIDTDNGVPEEVAFSGEQQPEAALRETMEAVREPGQDRESDMSGEQEAGQDAGSSFKALAAETASEKGQEVQPSKIRTEAKPQDRIQTEEKTGSHESLYGTAAARTETEHGFAVRKTEEIPLKTSQDTLPQDLGKTLAGRLPGTGKELVVELEPANLGKLTIKMVYEAGKAAVSIIATNPKTLEILNQKAGEIASILEEKTGQETIIYTQEAQQESQEENPDKSQGGQGGQQQGREERHQAREDRHRDAESFAQQLRLGLV